MVFELSNMFGVSFGTVFVVVIAGASLVIAYYKKKGLIKFQSPIKKIDKGEKKEDKDVN